MAINYKKCPNCGSTNVLGILYGMPTHEAFLKAEAGEIKLGGCCITGSDPEYYCKDCEHEWDKQQSIDYAYNQMELLITSVGGYFGGYYEVEINLISRELTWKHSGGGNEETYRKVLRNTTTDKLIEELKLIELLNWKSVYVDPHILDGTQWSIEIVRKGRNIKKHGSNMYPDGWERFCEIIRKISGRKFE